jgi:hypothetical protein
MPENPGNTPTQNICGAQTSDGTPCQRRVKPGSGPCAYHANTLKQKLKAWARNNTLMFVLAVIGAVGTVATVIALGGWVYDEFLKKTAHVAPRVGFLQLENYWFRPQKLVSDNLSISLWIRNDGDTPVEGEVHYFEASIVAVERDLLSQEQKIHAQFVSNALNFNADQIGKGFAGRPIGKGQGVWQTMTFPHLPQERIDEILKGQQRIFIYAWARWRDAPHDLDRCFYLQRPESLELKDNSLIWHLCADVPTQAK